MVPVTPNPMDLCGHHVLVTGAASGIGRTTAVLLDRLGATLSLVDRDSSGLAETLAGISPRSQNPFVFDLEKTSQMDGLVKEVVGRSGLLQGLVHCAGVQEILPAKSLTVDGWRHLFAINTEAGLALAKTFTSRRVHGKNGGAIVFISSVMGLVGSPGAVAYSMSKAALHGMTRSLALEFASRKVRVNCVAPGFVRTPLFQKTAQTWDEAQRLRVEAQHPLGFGDPEDVANAVAFLMAGTGKWITGTVLVVDGGYLAQ